MYKALGVALIVSLVGLGAYAALTSQRVVTVGQEAPDTLDAHMKKLVAFDYRDAGTPSEYVLYSYMGEQMPDKLDPREVKSMRNASSYTLRLSTPEEEATTGKYRMEYRGVPQPTYYNYNGTWYYLNYATATPAQFREAQYANPLSYLFGRVAYGASLTAGAGTVARIFDTTGYSSTRTNAVGNSAVTGNYQVRTFCNSAPDWNVYRIFFPYDTSSIPFGTSITSASISFTTNTQSNFNPPSGIVLVQTTQSTHTTLTTADYNKAGATTSPTLGAPLLQITSGATGPKTMNLNATGVSWIKTAGQASTCSATAGITCLGLRTEYDTNGTGFFDTLDCDGTSGNLDGLDVSISAVASMNSVYSSTFAPWQFWEY